MYQEYFGITDSPFSIAPDPRYLYLSESHQEAIGHLLYGIRSAGGFVVMTGEVGTGKTTVCRAILQKLPENTDVAFIINPRMTAVELLTGVCDELGIEHPRDGASIKALVDSLNAFLLSNHANGRNTLLIIDEAQNLSADVLEQIRLLTNLETNEKKLLQLVLIGQPELDELLAGTHLRQLSQRVTARYRLQPLSRTVVERYIAHRLKVAGFYGELFTPGATRRICRSTRGIPRLINVLCERCMMAAYVLEADVVTERIVRQALAELQSPDFDNGGRLKHLLGRSSLAVGIAAVMIIGALSVGFEPAGLFSRLATAVRQSGGASTPRFDSEKPAMAALLRRWGVKDGDDCAAAATHNLACLQGHGGWQQFAAYNRPGIVRFAQAGNGTEHWELIADRNDLERLRSGAARAWQGTFVLLWRPPAGSGSADFTIDDPAVVKDLDKQLAQLYGAPPDYLWTVDQSAVNAADGSRFEWLAASAPLQFRRRSDGSVDALLQARLRQFQTSRRLPATGTLDRRTWMMLNEAAQASVPTLTGSG